MKEDHHVVARVPTPRDILNGLKWRYGALDEAVVYYVHRGAPDDTGVIPGDRIVDLHRSWIELPGPEGNVMIPYHRIFRIDRRETTVWRRDEDPELGND